MGEQGRPYQAADAYNATHDKALYDWVASLEQKNVSITRLRTRMGRAESDRQAALAHVASLEATVATVTRALHNANAEYELERERVASLTEAIGMADMALGYITEEAMNRFTEDSPMLLIDVRKLDDVVEILRAVLAVGEGERDPVGEKLAWVAAENAKSNPGMVLHGPPPQPGDSDSGTSYPLGYAGHTDPTPPTCPTCGSTDTAVRRKVRMERYRVVMTGRYCTDPWHTDPTGTPDD